RGRPRLVGYLDERMALPLAMKFPAQSTDQALGGELNAIVGGLALGAALFFFVGGSLGFEELELATVARIAELHVTFVIPSPHDRFAVQGGKTRVLELAVGGVQILGRASHHEQSPADRAMRAFDEKRAAELAIVGGAVGLDAEMGEPG